MIDDRLLDDALTRARRGRRDGLEELFRALAPSAIGYLRARNASDPEGIADECFVRAFKALDRFEGDGAAFRSWLFTIVHRAAIDDARKRRRRVKESAYEARRHDTRTAPDTVMERLGGLAAEELLAQLSPDQRDVLLLRIVADLPIEATADALDKSIEAVKALQRRALDALRRHLADAAPVTEEEISRGGVSP